MIDGWILVLWATRRRLVGGRVAIPVGLVDGTALFLWKRGVTGSDGTLFTTGWDATVGVGCGGCRTGHAARIVVWLAMDDQTGRSRENRETYISGGEDEGEML